MEGGLTRYTRLINPALEDKAFDPDYLTLFFMRFGHVFDPIKHPLERANAEYIGCAVVMAADRINAIKHRPSSVDSMIKEGLLYFQREKPFSVTTALEEGILRLDGIEPSAAFIEDLNWNQHHVVELALGINYGVREDYPGSLLGPYELSRLTKDRFTVQECIEYCVAAGKRSASSPDLRKSMGMR